MNQQPWLRFSREKKAPWSGGAYRLGESEENVGENLAELRHKTHTAADVPGWELPR